MEDKQIKGGHGHHEKNEKDPDTVSLCDTCNRTGIYRNSIRSSKNSFIRGEEDFVSSKKEKDTDQRLVQMFKWQKRYFKDGKYLTGCHKLGKYVYLFDRYGVKQQKNTTYKGVRYFIDDREHVTGWRKGSTFYYNNGKRMSKNKALDCRAYQNARDVINKVTNKKMSKSQKLEACFQLGYE